MVQSTACAMQTLESKDRSGPRHGGVWLSGTAHVRTTRAVAFVPLVPLVRRMVDGAGAEERRTRPTRLRAAARPASRAAGTPPRPRTAAARHEQYGHKSHHSPAEHGTRHARTHARGDMRVGSA